MAQTIDFSAPFDSVDNWNFTFEDHRRSIDHPKVVKLCNKVSTKLSNLSLMPATEADLSTPKASMNFLLSNKTYFTVGEFTSCLIQEETAMSELMLALHSTQFSAVYNSQSETDAEQIRILTSQIESFKAQANQVEILQAQIKKIQGQQPVQQQPQNVNQSHQQNPNFLQVPNQSQSLNNNVNVQNFQTEINDQSFVFSAVNSGNVTPTARAPQPTVGPTAPNPINLNNDTQGQLDQITQCLAYLMNNQTKAQTQPPPPPPPVEAPKSRIKLTFNPDVYNISKHGDIRAYALNVFGTWAIAQGLTEAESTLFFSYAFTKTIHQNFVNQLARGPNGQPRFTCLDKLIEQVIVGLHLNEETLDELQGKYHNYKVCAKNPLDEEFWRVFNIRKLGWRKESEAICMFHAKIRRQTNQKQHVAFICRQPCSHPQMVGRY